MAYLKLGVGVALVLGLLVLDVDITSISIWSICQAFKNLKQEEIFTGSIVADELLTGSTTFLACDEIRDAKDPAQLAIFVRGINEEFNIT